MSKNRPLNSYDNLIVTYTIPKSYPHEPLAGNFEEWQPLPLFAGSYPEPKFEVLIINVGFLTMVITRASRTF